MADTWEKNQVDQVLIDIFGDDAETLGTVIFELCSNPQHYDMMSKLRTNPIALKAYAKKHFLPAGSGQGLRPSHTSALIGGTSRAVVVSTNRSAAAAAEAARASLTASCCAAGAETAAVSGNALTASVLSSEANRLALVSRQSADAAKSADQLAKYSKLGGRAAWVLTIGLLGYDFYKNIRAYWKGQQDGIDCAENLTASLASTVVSIGGSYAGAALGAPLGIPGILVGAVVGGLFAGGLTDAAVRGIFTRIFGSDRNCALQISYNILGLNKETATPEDIRKKYLDLVRKCHPDKGGDKEEFIRVNSAYELIRASLVSD